MSDNIQMVETINGEWVQARLGINPGTFAVLINEGILLTVHVSNHVMCFHLKDDDGVYNYLGDIQLKATESKKITLDVYSPSIEQLFIGKSKTPITNDLTKINDLKAVFSKKQKDIWFKRNITKWN